FRASPEGELVTGNTGTTARLPRPDGPAEPPSPNAFRILPVVAREGSPFSDMVSVGRSEGNDLILPDASVSKKHAYFSGVGPRGWTLTDEESTHGTWVGFERLPPHEARKLSTSEELGFGQLRGSLKDGGALWSFLRGEK